jgi:N,N-dimethylformamidase beta subunit-like protein
VSIAAENDRDGSTAWWGMSHAPPEAIEGYTMQPSVVAGDALELCVSTRPVARYATRVYRLGWYRGAGARLLATLPGNIGLVRHAPPPDPESGIVRASWAVTEVVMTEEDWPSGQYVAVLALTTGPHAGSASYVPFVLRTVPDDRPPILLQMPVNTTQAYNHWGGKCLYDSNSTDHVAAVKVSFDRPVLAWRAANLNARAPFVYELPLIRWLEREGFEIGYQTDVDTHRDPSSLVGRRLLITAGHDEYWTREMRDGFDEALARGVSLAFMGANTCYWQCRYEDRERTIVEYRHVSRDPHPDHALKTVRWRDLRPPRPERDLIGQQYGGGILKPRDVRAFRFLPDFATDRWADGVELDVEHQLERLVGYEWDTLDEHHLPPGCVRILRCEDVPVPADCIRWTAPSGSRVFSAGSLGLVWGLDDWASRGTADVRLQRVLAQGLREMVS